MALVLFYCILSRDFDYLCIVKEIGLWKWDKIIHPLYDLQKKPVAIRSIFDVLPEAEFVHGNSEMAGLVVTVVQVPVVHRNQVHVAENKAVVFTIFQSLRVTDVEKLGTVKRVFPKLKHNRGKTTN